MIHVFVTSHGGMAEGILESVEMLIGKQENLTAITFGKEMGVDELEECFQKEIVDVSEKNQYLILCDLKGGTPFNTASRFSFKNENVAVMYGMNLPLVITASLEASEEGQTLKKLAESLTAQLTDTIGLSELSMNQKEEKGMEVSVFRIDDRLIHGQVITAWIAYADAKSIVVADDKAAKDEFTQSLLKMATPDSIQLKILSVEDAITYLKGDEDAGKVLLLVRGPEQALQIIRAGIAKKDINVGNMNMKKGKTKVLSNLWVFPEDVENIQKLYEEGIKLEVRAIPSDRSQDVLGLLQKSKLI